MRSFSAVLLLLLELLDYLGDPFLSLIWVFGFIMTELSESTSTSQWTMSSTLSRDGTRRYYLLEGTLH